MSNNIDNKKKNGDSKANNNSQSDSNSVNKYPEKINKDDVYYSDEMSRNAVGKLFEEEDSEVDAENKEGNDSNNDVSSDDGIDEAYVKLSSGENKYVIGVENEEENPFEIPGIIKDLKPGENTLDYDYDLFLKKTKRNDPLSRTSPQERKGPQQNREPVQQKRIDESEPDKAAKRMLSGNHDYNTDEYEEYDDRPPYFKLISIGSIFVLVIIIAFLIIELNSINSKYSSSEKKLAEIDDMNSQYQDLRIRIDTYIAENDELKTQIERLGSAANTNPEIPSDNIEVPANEGNNATENEQPATPVTTTPAATTRQHIVKPGETLSSISMDYYGTSSKYPKIKEANKLTSDNIHEGDVLVIPE